MVRNPIYQPTGRAREYCDYAVNIYQGCPHRCTYCFAPIFLHKTKEEFHSNFNPRPGIIEATRKQLQSGIFARKTIQLCFTCDPYPAEIDTTPTREIIKTIKEAGTHVQILTKGGNRARRDFDLLDSGDSFGITLSCLSPEAGHSEPNAAFPQERIDSLVEASRRGIKTWISFEPVLIPPQILYCIKEIPKWCGGKTLLKIGKLNHVSNSIYWKQFGDEAERICKENGWNYYIKEDLRAIMNKE